MTLRPIEGPCSEVHPGQPHVDQHESEGAEASDPYLLHDARIELERLAHIIEGQDPTVRLVAPHGQTSNRPRAIIERIDRALGPNR